MLEQKPEQAKEGSVGGVDRVTNARRAKVAPVSTSLRAVRSLPQGLSASTFESFSNESPNGVAQNTHDESFIMPFAAADTNTESLPMRRLPSSASAQEVLQQQWGTANPRFNREL